MLAITLTALVLCNCLIRSMLSLRGRGSLRDWLLDCSAFGRKMLRQCQAYVVPKGSMSTFEAEVQRLVDEARTSRVLTWINIIHPLFVVVASVNLLQFAFTRQYNYELFEASVSHHRQNLFWRNAVVLCSFELIRLIPRRSVLKVVTMTWWCSSLFFFLSSASSITHSNVSYVLMILRPSGVWLRFSCAAMVGDLFLLCFQNLFSCAVFSYAYSVLKGPQHDNLPSLHSFILQEVSLAIGSVVVCWLLQNSMYGEARATLQQMEASQDNTTVQSLLSVLCDAVVHLDSDLVVSQHAPKLEATLMLTHHSAKGRSFLDLMVPKEAQRLWDKLDNVKQQTHAETIHTLLKDSNGIPVNVQMFIVHFEDIKKLKGYIIGIVELNPTAAQVKDSAKSVFSDAYKSSSEDGLAQVGRMDLPSACSASVSSGLGSIPEGWMAHAEDPQVHSASRGQEVDNLIKRLKTFEKQAHQSEQIAEEKQKHARHRRACKIIRHHFEASVEDVILQTVAQVTQLIHPPP